VTRDQFTGAVRLQLDLRGVAHDRAALEAGEP
jgi:hypothetical protein